MSFQDLPPRREPLSRLPAFAQYEDGHPPYQGSGTESTWYPGSSEFPGSPGDGYHYPRSLSDTNPGDYGDTFAGGPADTFAGAPGDPYRRDPRDAAQSPPWDEPPPQRTESYSQVRRTGPFYAMPDDEE